LIKVGIAAAVSIVAAIGLGVATFPANAGCQGTSHRFCSKTFRGAMRCEDLSGLAAIADNHCPAGQTCPLCPTGRDCPLIDPWEPVPIRIVGVELLLVAGSPTWAFVGNATVPDVMAKMGASETRVMQWFPNGLAFSMPAAPAKGHIDLHVAYDCGFLKWRKRFWKRAHYLLTIYYTTAD
jgi:hypothetical protein